MQLGIEFEQRFNQCILFPDERQMQDYAKYIIKLENDTSKVGSLLFKLFNGLTCNAKKSIHFLTECRQYLRVSVFII